jgi:CRISPR system Cascade subunit CasE
LKEFRRRDGSALTLPYAEVTEQETQKHHRTGGQTTHHAVLFEGTLTVTDPALFAEALASGFGAAKGFGFGLLSVARLT